MVLHEDQLLESLNLCLQLQSSDIDVVSDFLEPIDVILQSGTWPALFHT